jgi:hypothetical protein
MYTITPIRRLYRRLDVCLDFGKVKSLLILLLEKPRLDNNTSCPYVAEALPYYKGVSAQFVVNFRNCVFEYDHTKIGGNSELTMEDAAALTSHKKSQTDEMISTDDPMIAKNQTDLL